MTEEEKDQLFDKIVDELTAAYCTTGSEYIKMHCKGDIEKREVYTTAVAHALLMAGAPLLERTWGVPRERGFELIQKYLILMKKAATRS